MVSWRVRGIVLGGGNSRDGGFENWKSVGCWRNSEGVWVVLGEWVGGLERIVGVGLYGACRLY